MNDLSGSRNVCLLLICEQFHLFCPVQGLRIAWTWQFVRDDITKFDHTIITQK